MAGPSPAAGCSVGGRCRLWPSEDEARVLAALSAVLPGAEVSSGGGYAAAAGSGPGPLSRIRETAASRRSGRAYLRQMRANLDGDSTWLYLNKQAAAAGAVALCDDPSQSPLGPITVTLRSPRVADVMAWLASPAYQENSSR